MNSSKRGTYSRILPQFGLAFAAMQQTPRSVAMCLILLCGGAHWLHAQAVPAPTPVVGNFKTLNGKEYKNATVRRVEPDGIVLVTGWGISKVYFVELPKEVQEHFHYDAAKAAQFTTAEQAAVAQSNAVAQAAAVRRQQEAQERQRQIASVIKQQQEQEAVARQQAAQWQAEQQRQVEMMQQAQAAKVAAEATAKKEARQTAIAIAQARQAQIGAQNEQEADRQIRELHRKYDIPGPERTSSGRPAQQELRDLKDQLRSEQEFRQWQRQAELPP